MMSEKHLLRAVILWPETLCGEPDDITMLPESIHTDSC